MRTNHKEITRIIREKTEAVSDEQFFSSPQYAAYLKDLTNAAGMEYIHTKLKTIWDTNIETGLSWTDSHEIVINCGNPITLGLQNRQLRHMSYTGFFAHELAHILYTDFDMLESCLTEIEEGRLKEPGRLSSEEKIIYDEICSTIKTSKTARRCLVYATQDLWNIIEDVFVEECMCRDYPGTFKSGIRLNDMLRLKDAQAFKASDIPPFINLRNLFFKFSLGGELDESEYYSKILLSSKKDINESFISKSLKTRFQFASLLIIRWWNYFKDMIPPDQESGQNGSDSSDGEKQANQESGQNGSDSPDGDKHDQENGQEELEEAFSQFIKNSPLPKLTQRPEFTQNPKNAKQQEKQYPIRSKEISKTSDIVSQIEDNFIPPRYDQLWEDNNGTIDMDYDFLGHSYQNAVHEIQEIIKKAACQEVETERLEDIRRQASELSYGDVHKGIGITIHRMTNVPDSFADKYRMVSPPLKEVARQMKRHVEPILKRYAFNKSLNGQFFGKRLSSDAFIRYDGRLFSTKIRAKEFDKLAVAVLADQSDSMSRCNRIAHARAAAITLYEFCHDLNIPFMIYGHDFDNRRRKMNLYSYAEFDAIDGKDAFRLMDIAPDHCNRDGAALRYVGNQLMKRSERQKLLFLISDGLPNAYGYSREIAEDDLKGLKSEFHRKGIKIIAAAIGEDRKQIERIYGSGYLDISDLHRLPQNLAAVLIKNIKKAA